MEGVTNIKYLRISPKKIEESAAAVVGLSPQKAIERLTFMENKAARLLIKVIKSALANATNNLKLDKDRVRIKRMEVGKGPFFKRWNPVSRGRAHQIKKRTSHIKVVLEEVKS